MFSSSILAVRAGYNLCSKAPLNRLLGITFLILFGSLGLHAQDQSNAGGDEETFELHEKIVYSKVDERELLLDAFVPKKTGPHPALLVVHGGAWREGNRWQLRAYAKQLSNLGFVCFAIDYRLAPKHKFPAQFDDCRDAVKFIRQHAKQYKVDPKRLGGIGYSAGGHLVSLLGTTGEPASEENGNVDMRLQAVVAGGAPTDFRWLPGRGDFLEYWMGGNLDTAAEKFKAASSAAFVDKNDPPTFFFNGTKDKIVIPMWTQQCFIALKNAGVRTEMYMVQDANHLQAARDEKALEKAFQFLVDELLKEEKPDKLDQNSTEVESTTKAAATGPE